MLIEFAVADAADRRLTLGGRLARSDVSVPDWTVVLGRAGGEAIIGPDVTIECDRILVAAASLRVEARGEDDAVALQANSIEHEVGDFHLAGADRQRLRALLVSEQPVYPWTGFVSAAAHARDDDEPDVADAMRELKKLVTRFKPGPVKDSSPVLPVKIMDVLVARRRVSPDMHAYAVERGLITTEGKVCSLHPQQFGMNIVDLRERRVTPAVRVILSGYLRRGS